jgi:hypothetical protein
MPNSIIIFKRKGFEKWSILWKFDLHTISINENFRLTNPTFVVDMKIHYNCHTLDNINIFG